MSENGKRFVELLGDLDERIIREASIGWEDFFTTEARAEGTGDHPSYQISAVRERKRKCRQKATNTSRQRCDLLAKAACAVLAIGVFSLTQPQVRAALSNAVEKLSKILAIGNDLTSYTEAINQAQTKDGITATLGEVILADGELYASISLDWSETGEEPEHPYLGTGMLKINGENYEWMSLQSGVVPELDENLSNTGNYVIYYLGEEDSFSEDVLEIELTVNVYKTDDIDEEGSPFTWNFSASREELEENTLSVSTNKNFYDESTGVEFQMETVTITPVSSRIRISYNNAYEEREESGAFPMEDYVLRGTDSEGNEIQYSVSNGGPGYLILRAENIGWGEWEVPSVESEWIELQLYRADIGKENMADADSEVISDMTLQSNRKMRNLGIEEDEEETADISDTYDSDDSEDSEVSAADSYGYAEDMTEESEEEYLIEEGGYSLSDDMYVPVGEPVRIMLNSEGVE